MKLKKLKKTLGTGIQKSKYTVNDKLLDVTANEIDIDFVNNRLLIEVFLTDKFKLKYYNNLEIRIGNILVKCETSYDRAKIVGMDKLIGDGSGEIAKVVILLNYDKITADIV